jgi:hypothetical protein
MSRVYRARGERAPSFDTDTGQGQTMNTQLHLYIAQAHADELHRAAAMSRLPARRSRHERLRSCRTVVARRVRTLRAAPASAR